MNERLTKLHTSAHPSPVRSAVQRLRAQHDNALHAANQARRLAAQARLLVHVGVQDGVSPHQALPNFTAALAALPGVGTRFAEGGQQTLVDGLLAGALDMALLCVPPPLPPQLQARVLLQQDFVLAVPAGHRLLALHGVSLTHLQGERYCRNSACLQGDVFAPRFRAAGVRLNTVLESANTGWIAASVRAGHGVAFMPRAAAVAASLPFVQVVDCQVVSQVCLAWHGQREQPTHLRHLLTALLAQAPAATGMRT